MLISVNTVGKAFGLDKRDTGFLRTSFVFRRLGVLANMKTLEKRLIDYTEHNVVFVTNARGTKYIDVKLDYDCILAICRSANSRLIPEHYETILYQLYFGNPQKDDIHQIPYSADTSLVKQKTLPQPDFIVNGEHAGMSIRKAAQFIGVSHTAILSISGNLFGEKVYQTIMQQGLSGGNLTTLLIHYSQSSQVNNQVNRHCAEHLGKFSQIGAQAAIDQMAGIEIKTNNQSQPKLALPDDFLVTMQDLMKAANFKIVEQQQVIEKQSKKLDSQSAKVLIADRVIKGTGNLSMMEISKILKIGRTKLFKILRDTKVIQKNCTLPYQTWIDKGYMTTYIKDEKWIVPLVTPKGKNWLIYKINNHVKSLSVEEQLELELFNGDSHEK